jgi:spore maturation protein CgeB
VKEYRVVLSYGGLKTRDGEFIDLVPSEIAFIGVSQKDRYQDAKEFAVKECFGYVANKLQESGITPEQYPVSLRWREYRRNTWKTNPDWKFVCEFNIPIPWR